MKSLLVLLSLLILTPSLAWAGSESYTVGAACGTSASPPTPAGASASDWDTLMQCNGSTWQRASPFLVGTLAVGTTSLTSGTVLDMGSNTTSMLLPVGTTGQEPTCSSALQGAIRYNSSTSAPEYCNGAASAWTPFKPSGGPTGSGYFVLIDPNSANQGLNGCMTFARSIVSSYSGTAMTATISMTTNTDMASYITVGSSVTLANFVPTAYNGTFTVTAVTSSSFTVALGSNPGSLPTTQGSICAGSGGLAQANAICLYELTNNTGWFGYKQANVAGLLTSSHVTAFLCDNSSCQEPDANTTYYFANAGDTSAGGASFTTDANGYGPNDSLNWGRADHFGAIGIIYNYIWTGRNCTSSTKYCGTVSSSNCSSWTSTAGYGEYGDSAVSGTSRWSVGTEGCGATSNISGTGLICMVNP